MQDGRSFLPSVNLTRSRVGISFAVLGLVHGHVFALTKALIDSGSKCSGFWDDNPADIRIFHSLFPDVPLRSYEEILEDKAIALIVNCVRPDRRADLTCLALKNFKSVFSDKPGFLSLEEGSRIEALMEKSGCSYYIYFSEAFHSPGCIKAKKLIEEGRLGRVLHYTGFAPHRLNPATRPSWFFDSRINSNVLLDLGCHLVEQFLSFTNTRSPKILMARVHNHNHPDKSCFFDQGEAVLEGSGGVTGYIDVNWFTPDGLKSWGDCRTFVSGDKGFMEIRKYIDVSISPQGDHIYLVDDENEYFIDAKDQEVSFFSSLNNDLLEGKNTTIGKFWCLEAMKTAVQVSNMAIENL